MPQNKPKTCPLMSRPVLGNGNIIQLHRVECLRFFLHFTAQGLEIYAGHQDGRIPVSMPCYTLGAGTCAIV